MIEYALLFALGFLAAILLALVIAPAIHRRIVHYTERRIYATMPISPEEVRAQKDMERAAFAAETARTHHDLKEERETRIIAALKAEEMTSEAARMKSEVEELRLHIEDMNAAAADMRAQTRRATLHNSDLKAALNLSQTTIDTLREETDFYEERIRRLEIDTSNYRIDLAAREAEIDNLSARMQALRHERDGLRTEYRQTASSLTDLERRSGQSGDRVVQLEQKTLRQASELADMENRMGRNQTETERLRSRLRETIRQNEDMKASLLSAGILPGRQNEPETGSNTEQTMPADKTAFKHIENTRDALMERIRSASDGQDDDLLREDIAGLAALMTAQSGSEGKSAERIRDILVASPPARDGGPVSLANRIKTALAERELGRDKG